MPQARPRSHKRTLLKLGVFLLLGAVVNVAVAWGLTIRQPMDQVSLLFDENQGQFYSCGDKLISTRVGELCIRQWVHSPEPRILGITEIDLMSKSVGESEFASLVPAWSTFSDAEPAMRFIDRMKPEDFELSFVENSYGWPRLSLRWTMAKSDDGIQSVLEHFDGLHVSSGVLPLRPIASGFIINAVVYAAILWVLCFAPGKIRRLVRIRRGCCPACGYKIDSAPGIGPRCSECGAELPARLRPASP